MGPGSTLAALACPGRRALCFRFKFQTIDVHPRSRGGRRPRFSFRCPPQMREQECRMRAAPAVSCAMGRRLRTRAYRAAENIRHPLRNGSTAYNALTPGYRPFLPPSPHGIWHSGPVGLSRLRETWHQALRRQIHTPLPYASTPLVSTFSRPLTDQKTRPAIHRAHDAVTSTATPVPTFGNDGQRPFLRNRMA